MSIPRLTELLEIGYKGATVITDTALHTGKWKKIIAFEATAFTKLTAKAMDGNTIIGQSVPTNHELTGEFTEITLASGAVVAYK